MGDSISKDHKEPESTKSCPDKAASIHSGSNPTPVAEASVAITKADTSKKDLEDTQSINRKLRAMLLKLHEPEAVNTHLQQNIFCVAENGDGGCKRDERSQKSSFLPIFEGSSEIKAAHSLTNVQGGRWFETPGGSLMRMESRETLHDNFPNDEWTSKRQNHVSQDEGRLAHSSIATRGDDNADEIPDGQLVIPNQQDSEAVHVFQVPDIDENDDNHYTGDPSNNEDDQGHDEIEDGEIDDEASSSFQTGPDTGSKEPASRTIIEPGVKNEPQVREMVDSGSFTALQVCRALGNGNLDEQRMRRLRKGFMALLDDAMGRYRRCV